MGNASQKQTNSTTIKSTISCALQVSWIPIVCYAQHVEWSGLPIERALPLACYFAAVLFAAACVMHFMKETLKSDSGHVLDIGAIATYAFGIALLLATGQSEGNAPISCIAFALIGCSSGIGVLQLERCLMCLEPKQTTFATLVAVFVACAVILVLPIFSAPIALVASLVFVAASCLARPRLECPKIDPSTIDSKLLRAKIDSFNKRTATAMFLLGAASTVPISLFVSSDVSFIGDSIQVATMVNAWAPLAFVLFAGIVVIDWLPNREPNPFGSLRALFAIALLSFFPISPGSEFNMWFVLIFSMVWVVSLAGVTLLVSCEIDQKYAECGRSALGRNVSFLCIGVLVGLAVIMFVKSFVPQFAGIVGRNSDGTMLICSMSMTCVMLLFLATNTLITKDMLHEVALFGRGKLAFHVPEEAIHEEKQANRRQSQCWARPRPTTRAPAPPDRCRREASRPFFRIEMQEHRPRMRPDPSRTRGSHHSCARQHPRARSGRIGNIGRNGHHPPAQYLSEARRAQQTRAHRFRCGLVATVRWRRLAQYAEGDYRTRHAS